MKQDVYVSASPKSTCRCSFKSATAPSRIADLTGGRQPRRSQCPVAADTQTHCWSDRQWWGHNRALPSGGSRRTAPCVAGPNGTQLWVRFGPRLPFVTSGLSQVERKPASLSEWQCSGTLFCFSLKSCFEISSRMVSGGSRTRWNSNTELSHITNGQLSNLGPSVSSVREMQTIMPVLKGCYED